ncbi:MAG: cache domain-containing protein [Syntrophales bacterium]
MKRIIAFVLAVCFTAGISFAAGERGNLKEAQAMVKKAVAYYKEVGREKAIAEFGNPHGKFIVKDLYISVYDMNGNVVSHPYNKGLIGKNLINIQDPDGKMFIKEFVDKAAKSPSGYVDYKYTHPQTKKVEPKTAYFERVGNLIIQVGAYK